MAAAVLKTLENLNISTSRTNTFNLEQIPFCCSLQASLSLSVSLSHALFFCAASCICHCHGEQQPKHVAALNFAQFLLHVLLFFVSFFSTFFSFLFASHALPSIVLRSPAQSTPAARCSVRLHKLTHKKEQHHHHDQSKERASERALTTAARNGESRRLKESKSKERLNKEGDDAAVVVVVFFRCWLFSSKIFLFVCSSFDSYVNFHIC